MRLAVALAGEMAVLFAFSLLEVSVAVQTTKTGRKCPGRTGPSGSWLGVTDLSRPKSRGCVGRVPVWL